MKNNILKRIHKVMLPIVVGAGVLGTISHQVISGWGALDIAGSLILFCLIAELAYTYGKGS